MAEQQVPTSRSGLGAGGAWARSPQVRFLLKGRNSGPAAVLLAKLPSKRAICFLGQFASDEGTLQAAPVSRAVGGAPKICLA